MAKLIQKKDGFWCDLTIRGKRVRDFLSIYRPIAQRKLDEMKALARDQRHGLVPENLSWDLFKQKYLAYSIDKDESTLYFVNAMFKMVDQHLSIRALREMTPDRLSDLKAKLIKLESAPSMVTRLLREVKTAMRYAEDMKYVGMQNWRIVKLEEPAGRVDFYEFDAYDDLLDFLKNSPIYRPWYTPVYLMCRAGLRLSEVHFLEWPDIQFASRRIYLRSKDHLGWRLKSDKKGNKFRVIPLSLDYGLEAHLKSICKPSGFVLGPNRLGTAHSFGKKIVEALAASGIATHLGVSGSAHVLRHTFGSHLAQKGVSLKQIAEWMGHSTTRMTEIYAHLVPGNPSQFSFQTHVDYLSTSESSSVSLDEQQQNNEQFAPHDLGLKMNENGL